MTFQEIMCMPGLNDVDSEKVNALAQAMLENGWQGAPILVYGESLLTGSHRVAALHKIYDMVLSFEIDDAEVLHQDIAEDVTEIVLEHIAAREEEEGDVPDIDYQNIGWLLEGSWVEQYKDEIAEW